MSVYIYQHNLLQRFGDGRSWPELAGAVVWGVLIGIASLLMRLLLYGVYDGDGDGDGSIAADLVRCGKGKQQCPLSRLPFDGI